MLLYTLRRECLNTLVLTVYLSCNEYLIINVALYQTRYASTVYSIIMFTKSVFGEIECLHKVCPIAEKQFPLKEGCTVKICVFQKHLLGCFNYHLCGVPFRCIITPQEGDFIHRMGVTKLCGEYYKPPNWSTLQALYSIWTTFLV